MQAPPPHPIDDVAIAPWKLAAVEARQEQTHRAPELGPVVGQVLGIAWLEDFHADVEGQRVVLEQGGARRVAEQVLREGHLDERDADAHAGELELRIQGSVENEAIEPRVRRAAQPEDLRQVGDGAVMIGNSAAVDHERIEAAADPLRHDAIERRMQDDVDVRVNEIPGGRRGKQAVEQIAEQGQFPRH